jgi:ACS family hexuronate transporter-like MFS transporter
LGLGEAGNFPAAVKVVAEWFPRRERALATGLFNSGSNVGAIIAPLLVPWITLRYCWQAAFLLLGAMDWLWLAAWWWLYQTPAGSRRLSAAELAHIQSDPPEPPVEKVPWRKLLGYRQTWAFVVCMAFSTPIWWFFHLGPPLVVVYSLTCVGSIGGGWLSSHFLRRGWSVNASRKTAMLICALCVVPVVFAPHASNLWEAALLIGLATSAHQGWAANIFTLVSDMFPKQAVASVVGLGGMFGSVASMLFAKSAGYFLERTGSYWSLFLMASSAYLLALAIVQILIPNTTPVVLPATAKE